jgi:hypothetical protein
MEGVFTARIRFIATLRRQRGDRDGTDLDFGELRTTSLGLDDAGGTPAFEKTHIDSFAYGVEPGRV